MVFATLWWSTLGSFYTRKRESTYFTEGPSEHHPDQTLYPTGPPQHLSKPSAPYTVCALWGCESKNSVNLSRTRWATWTFLKVCTTYLKKQAYDWHRTSLSSTVQLPVVTGDWPHYKSVNKININQLCLINFNDTYTCVDHTFSRHCSRDPIF